jgi:hypothetical protein
MTERGIDREHYAPSLTLPRERGRVREGGCAATARYRMPASASASSAPSPTSPACPMCATRSHSRERPATRGIDASPPALVSPRAAKVVFRRGGLARIPDDNKQSMVDDLRQGLIASWTAIQRTIGAIQRAPVPIVAIAIGIAGALIGISNSALISFLWSIIIVTTALILLLVVLWFKFPVGRRLPATPVRTFWSFLIVAIATAALWTPMHSKYKRDYPPPSIVYINPGVWSASPVPKWIMIVDHCGPEPLFNISIHFSDDDRTRSFAGRPSITPEEIADAQMNLHLQELDPTQGGPMFAWTPVNPDQESYTIRIGSRGLLLDQSLKIIRAEGKWYYRITVTDVTGSHHTKIIDCRDAGFPASSVDRSLPACFPRYVAGEHWTSCE